MNDQDLSREELLEEIRWLRAQRASDRAILEAHEQRLEAFIDNSPALAFMKDENGRYIYFSRNFQRFVGRDPLEFLGKTDFEVFPAEIARQLRENDLAVLASGKVTELKETLTGPDGSLQHWLVFKFPFWDSAGNRYLGGGARDVTLRWQAEEKQREYAERLQALSRRLVEVQEEERRRLARELHDEVGQTLTSLRFLIEECAGIAAEPVSARLGEARALLAEALNQIRNLSFELRPALLDHLGLSAAIRSFAERFTASTRILIDFKHGGLERRLPPEVETAAFRMVQEALTNVARHARVVTATVRVWVDGDCLEVQVEDEGVGFDPNGVWTSGKSNGLTGMAERVQLLNGALTIESEPGGGTQLLARFPLNDARVRQRDEHLDCAGG